MKKTLYKNIFLALCISLLLTGCVEWQNVTGLQKIKSQKITLDLKNEKWHALDDENFETYILTKDGVLLQYILLKRVGLDKALAISKKSISENILPQDLAELIIENLKLENSMNSFQVLSNKPDKIDSIDAVQIISQTKDSYENLIKNNSTFFIFDKKLYSITYDAPNQFFYDRDIKKYNQIKKSIKLSL